MRKQGHIKRLLCVGLLFSVGLSSCSLIHDDDMDCQLYTEEGVPYAYVSIALNTSATTPSTRADDDPTGGESGDGPEEGQDYENEVRDITLFFYEATNEVTGVNADAKTSIVARRSLSKNDFTYTQGNDWASTNSIEVEQLLVNHSYHVLAVVNAKDILGELLTKDVATLTLRDLQQATVTELYDVSDNSYSNFLMASADDEKQLLDIRPNNSVTNPAPTKIDVERVTARVDYRAVDPNGTTANDNKYEVPNLGTVEIKGAMLVNTYNNMATSYLLKRVTTPDKGFTSDIIYLGDETPTPSGIATNYVIDPLSRDKSDRDMSASYDNYFNNISYDNAAEWENNFIEGVKIIDSQGVEWKRVGYPKENTAEKGSRYYSTGIVFKAEVTLTDANAPTTLFEYNGKVYTNLEAIMRVFEGEDIWKLIIEGNWSAGTWQKLHDNVVTRLLDNDPTGYKAFLQDELAKQTDLSAEITSEELAALKWDAYCLSHLYYTNIDGTVSIDVKTDNGSTRLALSEVNQTDGKLPDQRIRTYKNGIAYYTYWIKHSNDDNNANDGAGGGIMEYGIVRNNIYQLNVTGISGLGDDVPGDRTLEINVTVRNWEQMDPENVEMK